MNAPHNNLNSSNALKLVTCALPYANNHLHLGHLLEQIQADIWVRFLRARGEKIQFICGDDTHGTPIMLQAQTEGVLEEVILDKYYQSHCADSVAFGISFDHYDSTDNAHCRQMVCDIYEKVKQSGYIYKKTIEQLYDPVEKMFLPDRMVKGGCPQCQACDQYGDSCEKCGATYSAEKLLNPRAVATKNALELRESEHIFFDLKQFESNLKKWLEFAPLQKPLIHKNSEWLKQGLLSWDISRDAPYFGVAIPNEPGKFFYVWLDAVSGYIGASKMLWKNDEAQWENFWSKNSPDELHQFIGKDIAYFHTLFWPAILNAAGFRTPTRVHAHGYLTMKKEKMSKSRKTFIFAKDFRKYFDPEVLRYYLACKLNEHIEDVDFSLEDLVLRVNTDLVGKIANLAARSAKFIHTYFDGTLSAQLTEDQLYQKVCDRVRAVELHIERLEYSKAIRLLLQFADEANSFFDYHRPWAKIKEAANSAHVHAVCTEALSVFRVIVLELMPILPNFAEKSLKIFEGLSVHSRSLDAPLGVQLVEFQKLFDRIDPKTIEQFRCGHC